MTTSPYTPYGGVHNIVDQDIVQGLFYWLKEKQDLMDLLGHMPGHLPYSPALFIHELGFILEEEQTNTCTIKYAGGWAAPNNYNTMEFPRIALQFHCSPIRNDHNMVADRGAEAIRRVMYIYKQFDKYMHRPAALEIEGSQSKIEMWGTVRTLECARQAEINIESPPDADGIVIGTVYYAVTVG